MPHCCNWLMRPEFRCRWAAPLPCGPLAPSRRSDLTATPTLRTSVSTTSLSLRSRTDSAALSPSTTRLYQEKSRRSGRCAAWRKNHDTKIGTGVAVPVRLWRPSGGGTDLYAFVYWYELRHLHRRD